MSHAILDAVYGAERAPAQRPWRRAAALALLLHVTVLGWASLQKPTLEVWSAALALDVHNALGREDVVTLETPPPPSPPKTSTPVQQVLRPARKPATLAPAPPAAAAQVVARDEGPIDLAETTFVTGSATRYAGGATAATGVSTPAAPVSVTGPDQSESVRLDATEWSCMWPKEADRAQIDEQRVVIKVEVEVDGSVLHSQLVRGAEYGFGAAALQCAKRTRFEPARDRNGKPVRAWSPPIEVTFSR